MKAGSRLQAPGFRKSRRARGLSEPVARSLKPVASFLALLLAAWSPFLRPHPLVEEGNAQVAAGDPDAALLRYDAAEREVGQRPELDFDRGHAHAKAGRTADAIAAWRRAAEGADPKLASRALQNAGTALDRGGDRAGAIRALTDALAKDPGNDDARYDLEVLLRRPDEEPPARGPGRDQSGGAGGGTQAAGKPSQGDRGPKPDTGTPAGEDPKATSQRPEPRPDGAPDPADRRPDRESPSSGAPRPETSEGAPRDAEGAPREALTRHEAEALLDALRARERNMPVGSPTERRVRRTDAERDW